MRQFIWLLSIISMFILVNCGGGSSSKEAKELLQKILQIVGIPHEIVVNICQDGNENGICENFELQTKVTLNKGDSFDDIWQKITLTEDGKYFLETRDPTKPILLELQDEAKVNYDNGKFTLPFNGFKTYEQNETKELSILASMVDKNYFSDSDLTAIRNLKNNTTQDKFYAKLLDALETNINTLRGAGLDAQNSMLANLKEMASELIANGIKNTLPKDLNNCGIDMGCVDTRLETVYDKITISTEKANVIKETYTEPTPTVAPSSSGKRLLVSKETSRSSTDYSDTTTTTTYEYNSQNLNIKDTTITVSTYNGRENSRTEDICTHNYDNKNRYIGNVCTLISDGYTTNYNEDFIYKDNRLSMELYYDNDGMLSQKWEVVEWNGDKPKKVKNTSYNDGKESVFTWTITYSGNNPTILSGESENSSWIIERKFDTKKIPYYYDTIFQSGSYIWFGWTGENNIIKETTTNSVGDITVISTQKNSITYNGSELPIKIDTTTTYSNSDIITHTVKTYEYIEAK